MDIKINKDIAKEYPDDTYKGFSVRQLICIGVAAVLGGGTILLLYYVVGLNVHIAVYGAFPLATPVILAGFIRYKGMPLLEALKEWVRLQDQPVMAYEAQENHYDCCGTCSTEGEDDGKAAKKKKRGKGRERRRGFRKKGGKK